MVRAASDSREEERSTAAGARATPMRTTRSSGRASIMPRLLRYKRRIHPFVCPIVARVALGAIPRRRRTEGHGSPPMEVPPTEIAPVPPTCRFDQPVVLAHRPGNPYGRTRCRPSGSQPHNQSDETAADPQGDTPLYFRAMSTTCVNAYRSGQSGPVIGNAHEYATSHRRSIPPGITAIQASGQEFASREGPRARLRSTPRADHQRSSPCRKAQNNVACRPLREPFSLPERFDGL